MDDSGGEAQKRTDRDRTREGDAVQGHEADTVAREETRVREAELIRKAHQVACALG